MRWILSEGGKHGIVSSDTGAQISSRDIMLHIATLQAKVGEMEEERQHWEDAATRIMEKKIDATDRIKELERRETELKGEITTLLAENAEMQDEEEELERRLGEAEAKPERWQTFDRTAGQQMADEINRLVLNKTIDARSPAADASLEFANPDLDRIDEIDGLRTQLAASAAELDDYRSPSSGCNKSDSTGIVMLLCGSDGYLCDDCAKAVRSVRDAEVAGLRGAG